MVTVQRRIETQAEKLSRLTGKKSPQHAFNSVLWDMVSRHGGTMAIRGSDLKKIPNSMTLQASWDEASQSLIIKSVVKHGKILAPSDNGIIIQG